MQKFAASATLAALALLATDASATDWSGFYVAGHVDGGWMNSDWSGFDGAEGGIPTGTVAAAAISPTFINTVHFNLDNKDTGWGGGAGIGYNMQFDQVVLGAVVDWTWLNADETRAFPGSVGPDTVSTHVNSIGTFRGLVGFDMDRVMPYATAGWAWGDVSRRFTTATGFTGHLDADNGWTAGGGLAFVLGPNTALNVEALYVDFGSADRSFATSLADADVHVKTHMTVARVGVTFRL